MPFPLKSLHYDLCRRLRELASPAEAYDLQIAAPHFYGLKPLQQTTHPSPVIIVSFNDNHQLCAESVSMSKMNDKRTLELNNSVLHIVEQSLILSKFTTLCDAKIIFDHFILAPREIRFYDCDLTPKLLYNVSEKIKKNFSSLNITFCRFHDGATFELVCKLFKKPTFLCVCVLDTSFVNHTWIDALTANEYSNMHSIDIHHVGIDILNIDESQLIEFMKAQQNFFMVNIVLKNEIDDSEVKQSLNRLFGDLFEPLGENTYARKYITIRWTSSETHHKRTYGLRDDSVLLYCKACQ
uniref:F-box domain-containing protein n=1 Tax=Panagrellus redivivus TaxID=6233 RepID=A0A7E4ZSC5_PANRE